VVEERSQVLQTLTLSGATENALRRSNKNPARIRAQLVRYSSKTAGKVRTYEKLELLLAPERDARAGATPFLILNTVSKLFPREGKKVEGYGVISDITTQFTHITYPQMEIGAFLVSEGNLDLCVDGNVGKYGDLCRFDNDGTRKDFRIFAWLRGEVRN
jgi:hypothetical protein